MMSAAATVTPGAAVHRVRALSSRSAVASKPRFGATVVPRARAAPAGIVAAGKTMYDKIMEDHIVDKQEDGTCLIYIDRHMVHEVTSPQAFEVRLFPSSLASPLPHPSLFFFFFWLFAPPSTS